MSTRTFLTQEIRPYKIDVYGLQDNYIGTLQSYNDNFIGQTTEPLIVVSKDGTQSFTCSIPKYYIDPITNEKIINPRWEDTKNGVLAENTRILKAFVNFKDETKVFPFIVDEIKDKRDSHFSTFKEIKANGLAFAELGKIGYKIELNQTLFESNELEENPEAIMTIQYWLDQVFPSEKDENGNIIKWLTPWCYEIRMDWSQYPTENRLATKVYDDRFINSWAIDDNTNELIANGIQVSREKSRAIDCKNSNKYNITQDIAKAFEVFCDYEYKTAANGQFIKEYTDENGLVWTGRKVIFYNSAINIDNPLYLNYQKNLQTIERTAESSELYTKLFVTPSESSIMKNGYVTIADTFANPTLDDFILNFDYLYSVGSISDYQMQFAKNYEVEVRRINSHLMAKSPVIDDLVVEINDREAEIAGYDKQIASAREQYTYYEKLKNSQVTNNLVVKNEANPYSTIFVPEGTVYRAALKLEGIIASSIKGYINKYSEPLFENADLKLIKSVDEIDDSKNYFLLLDEHDFPSAIYSIITPSDVVLYLDLEYSPRNKYENICASFLNEIDNYEKQKITVEEIVTKLESQLEKAQKEYNDKLKEKEELNRKLERIMGPALREGYWTPDRYDDVGQAHIKKCSFNNGIEFTTSLFENEQLSYVDIGKDRIYYPYINIDNQLKNKWMGHDLNNLILHLQRDFIFTATEQATLDVGNYYFLYNSRQYYFKLDNKLAAGDSLTIKVEGATINLILNNSSSIELVSFLEDAINVTQRFEDSTVTLGDYLLYNNAGFIFSFKHNENNELIPILLLNNDKLFGEYRKYDRLAYSFQGETVVTLIEGIIQDYPNIAYSIYFPRILLAEDNVIYTSDTLTITVGKDENAIELKKYYDYSVLLHEGKTCITLKLTGNNPFYNLVDASIIYNVNYRVSQANEALYIDAKQVAKDNSKPKFSYDISVALISSWEDNQIEKMPLIELGQLAYISDPILGVHAATGYVSEITYKLDKPQEDEIKIQNYKTKFEDLFETITASSEAMKNNQIAYDIAAGNFGPNGAISGDVIQTAINNNDFFFNYSTTGVDINPTEGIVLTNKKPYANGVYGQVVLQGGGIFLSDSVANTGERIWNNGITPKGINASLITSGQINTNVIKVFSGDDMTFQWNSEGIYSYKLGENGRPQPDIYVKYSQQGLHLTDDTLENWDDIDKVNGHQSLVSLDWDGLTLRNNSGQKTLSADLDGNLTIRGTLKSYDYREGESRLLSTGWKIEPTGYAEFNDLFVRGTISASVFEYEETSAVGGRLLVSPTFILKSEHTNKASIQMAADTPLKIIVPIGVSIANNSFVAGGRTWKLNDIVIFNGKFINKNAFPLIKLGKNINDYPIYETKQLHMVISNLNPTNNTITLTSIAMVDGLTQNLFYGADGNIVDANSAIIAMGGMENIAGTGDWHLISFGTDGAKEGILLTAIEPNSGSYIDILGKGKDNLTGSTRVRLGDLSGLAANQELIEALGVTPQGWGLYADNAYLRGAIYATSGKIGSLSINEVENANSGLSISLTSNTAFTMKENSTDLQIGFRLYCGGKEILTRADLPSFIRNNNFTVAYQAKTNGTWRLFTYFNPAKNLFDDNGNIINTTYKFANLPTDEAYRVCIFETINNETSEIYSDIQKYTLITDGEDGNSIIGIQEVYGISESAEIHPTTWYTDITDAIATTELPYLWIKETTSYSKKDDEVIIRLLSKYTENGRSIVRIENWYTATTRDVDININDISKYQWYQVPPTTNSDVPLLWGYELVWYKNADGTETSQTLAPRIISAYGETGETGKGIIDVIEEYAASDSNEVAPEEASSWTTFSAAVSQLSRDLPYLWCRETITYTSGSADDQVFERIISTYGEGISSITNWYWANNIATSAEVIEQGLPPTNTEWTKEEQDTTAEEPYLWNYEVIEYTNLNTGEPTSISKTFGPRLLGYHGADGQPGEPGQNAIQYKIIPSATSIVRDLGGSMTPSLIQFSITKIDGATTETTISTAPFTLTVELSCDDIVAILTPTKTERYFTQLLSSYSNENCSSLTAYLKDTSTNKTLDVLTIPFELGDKLRELGTIKDDGEVIVADGKVTANAIVAGAITAAKIETGAIAAGALTNIGELYLMTLGNGSLSHPSITAPKYWSNGVFDALEYDKDIHNNNVYNYGLSSTTGIRLSSEGIDMKGAILAVDMENFKIDSNGNVELTGKITADNGKIGGWTIGTDTLYSGEGTTRVELSSSSVASQPYAIWAGDNTASNAPFSVTKTGALKSTSGEIGGWNINTNTLTIGTAADDYIGIGTSSDYRIWVGNSAPADAKFSVKKDGALKAAKGTIGGWDINEYGLYSGSETTRVSLNSSGEGENANYAIWAGANEPQKTEIENGKTVTKYAPFAVTRDGRVYLTRIMALANETDTTPTEVNLSSSYWQIWSGYSGAVKSFVKTNETEDSVTLTLTTKGGGSFPVTFKKAGLNKNNLGIWGAPGSSKNFTIRAGNKTTYVTEVEQSGTLALTSATKTGIVTASIGNITVGQLPVEEVFVAGENQVLQNSSLKLTGSLGQAVVEAVYNENTYKSFPLADYYIESLHSGASAAITGATLGPLTISSDGKTATAVLSHPGVEETKTIEGIDTSEAYNIGASGVSVDTVVITGNTWTQGEYAYANVTATASNTKYKTQQISIHAKDIYDAGADSITVTGIEASGPVYGEKTVSVNMEATLSDGRKAIFSSSNIDCTKIYENGENSVTIDSIVRDGEPSQTGKIHSITVKATASNGAIKSQTFSTTCNDIWNDGVESVTVAAPTQGNSWISGTTVYIVANVKASNGATNSATLERSVSSVYNTGWNACLNNCKKINACEITSQRTDLYEYSSGSYVPTGQTWCTVKTIDAYTIPSAK